MASGELMWKIKLFNALKNNEHLRTSKFCQLATLREDRRPANRTVVYRGLLDNKQLLYFWTDLRSAKVAELELNPFAEICWYFTETWEQFRFSGQCKVVGPTELNSELKQLRETSWNEASVRQKLQFLNPPPGENRQPETNFPGDMDPKTPVLPNFGILTLEPETVDYVNLKDNKREFHSTNEEGHWIVRDVNP